MNSHQDHILVVDDDPEIRHLLQSYLEKNGYQVSTAAEGGGMWQALERSRIDLIVLDLMLPGVDGLELCRNLRARSRIPVIMLTARGDEMDRVLGLEMGADDYLAKPFSSRELLARIKVVLRRVRDLPIDPLAETPDKLAFSGWVLDTRTQHLTSPEALVIRSLRAVLVGGGFITIVGLVDDIKRGGLDFRWKFPAPDLAGGSGDPFEQRGISVVAGAVEPSQSGLDPGSTARPHPGA